MSGREKISLRDFIAWAMSISLFRDMPAELLVTAKQEAAVELNYAAKAVAPSAQSPVLHLATAKIGVSRKSIKKTFPKISHDQWRGLFSRESDNGLEACRLSGTSGKHTMYDSTKVAHWIANTRDEYTLEEALRLTNPTTSPETEPKAFSEYQSHDPFRLTKHRD